MMEKQVNRILNVFYYGCYVLAVVAAGVMFWLVRKQGMEPIDVMSAAGKAVQYVVIVYTVGSVAGGLYLFKRMTDKMRRIDDKEEQLRRYRQWGIVRIVLIGTGVTLGIVAFYLLGGYTSMIWCAAISAIGLYFCKPTLRKMELELSDSGQPKGTVIL